MSLTYVDFGFQPINDKVVLLTGASSGMGRAAALLLARGGARLALVARRKERLESLTAEITKLGAPKPLVIVADVRRESDCRSAVQNCHNRFGRIDVLINNAGVGYPSELESAATDQYRSMMETNVDGVFFLTRAVLPIMKEQKRGDIIMISSPAGVTANPVAPLYCASKFALEGFTEGLRLQLDQLHGQGIHIRVVDILPGATNSEYWGDRQVPRESFMTSEEMAAVILQTVATSATVLVKKIQVEQFRFSD
jgi:NADP-dependent 3-hydroxy acid dehydrogenase YdfG